MKINNRYVIGSDGQTIETLCREILSVIDSISGRVVRIVFFGDAASNEEYVAHHRMISSQMTSLFGDNKPLWSYIAQPPFEAKLAAEIWSVDGGEISYRELDRCPYIVITDGSVKRLMMGGVQSPNLDQKIYLQACEVFSCVKRIMEREQMPLSSIVRQWNYLENILYEDDDNQHYQELNDARSELYNLSDWECGYPSATGIGTLAGGVIVDIDAVVGERVLPIDNKLQIAAHQYSRSLLLGAASRKSRPKFERAKICGGLLYISGTAAIRGEESLVGVSAARQSVITLENIDFLLGVASCDKVLSLRVYIKNSDDYPQIRQVVDSYGCDSVIYILGDICRDELLMEIEAVGRL